ncbi:MAG TPA: hypothetical protein VFF57_01755, partial [Hanamia sp.]|nr:hypothetical protein [Hanamia sp.]
MKKLIKKIFHKAGFDLTRYRATESKGSKRTDRLKLYETATGKYYLPQDAYADTIANTIINNNIYDNEIVECARKYIKPGTIVLDVGANFGQMSILFSE